MRSGFTSFSRQKSLKFAAKTKIAFKNAKRTYKIWNLCLRAIKNHLKSVYKGKMIKKHKIASKSLIYGQEGEKHSQTYSTSYMCEKPFEPTFLAKMH